MYFEKPYYLVPVKKAEKGYVLLREALKKTGKVAIGRVVIRTREYLSAVVPRGDALFSYRLLETMARGAIPVILSDGWVLPFDRLVNWSSCCVSFHHEALHRVPETLRAFTPQETIRMRQNVRETYARFFANLDRIVAALLQEMDLLENGPL